MKLIQCQPNREVCPAEMSGLLKGMLYDQEKDDRNNQEIIIHSHNIDGKILSYVITCMNHHWNNKTDDIEKTLKRKVEDVISE